MYTTHISVNRPCFCFTKVLSEQWLSKVNGCPTMAEYTKSLLDSLLFCETHLQERTAESDRLLRSLSSFSLVGSALLSDLIQPLTFHCRRVQQKVPLFQSCSGEVAYTNLIWMSTSKICFSFYNLETRRDVFTLTFKFLKFKP